MPYSRDHKILLLIPKFSPYYLQQIPSVLKQLKFHYILDLWVLISVSLFHFLFLLCILLCNCISVTFYNISLSDSNKKVPFSTLCPSTCKPCSVLLPGATIYLRLAASLASSFRSIGFPYQIWVSHLWGLPRSTLPVS